MRHRAKRVWFMPWKTRCSCGCPWHPCPDSITMNRSDPGLRQSCPDWNAPTARYATAPRNERPFMTPGQEWRTRPGRR